MKLTKIFGMRISVRQIAGIILLCVICAPTMAEDLIVNADTSLEWNQKQAFYQARGNAHAYQGAQEIFADDLKAYYDPQTTGRDITQIHASGNVRFSDAAHTGSGASLIYQSSTKEYKLSGPDARIDGPDGRARADQEIHFQQLEKKVILRQSAEIALKDGRRLTGNELYLFLDSQDNIERIEARGNVSVTQASGSLAKGDILDYDKQQNKAVLQGQVTVIDGQNQLSGDKAEIDFATGLSKMLTTTSGGRVSGRFTGLKQ